MKRGRPRVDPTDRTVPLSFGLPRRQHDALCRQAVREGISLPQLVRRAIDQRFSETKNRKP